MIITYILSRCIMKIFPIRHEKLDTKINKHSLRKPTSNAEKSIRISDLASVAPRKIRKSLFTMQIFNFNLTGGFPAKQFKIPKLSINTAKFPLIWRDFLDFQSKLLHSVNFFLQFCSTVCQFQQIKKKWLTVNYLHTKYVSQCIDIYHNCIIFSVALSVAIKVFQIFGIFSCVFCASRLREVSISLCVRNCSHALSSYSLLSQASPAGVETSTRSVVSQFLTLAQIERRSRKEELDGKSKVNGQELSSISFVSF